MTAPRKSLTTVIGSLALLAALSGSATAADRNDDRIPDRWELRNGLSLDVSQTHRDPDRDGLENLSEFRSGTDPLEEDSDTDGVEDGDEDADRDRVDNYNEQHEGTRPDDRDTDNDGKSDAREDADRDGLKNGHEDLTGNDPLVADTDGDGVVDGREAAGRIVSFDGVTLSVGAFGGPSLTAPVTAETKITCETEDEHEAENETEETEVEEAEGKLALGRGNEIDEEERGDDDNVCTVDDLAPGAVVHKAKVEIDEGAIHFEEVELIK